MSGTRLLGILLLFFIVIKSFSQTDSIRITESIVRVYYNISPDSLFINDSLVTVQNEEDIRLPLGKYNFRAVRDCYHEDNKTLEVSKKKRYQIGLKLKKITTGKQKAYKYSYVADFLMIPFLFSASVSGQSPEISLPHVIAGTAFYGYWKLRQFSNFDVCNGQYLVERDRKNWGINLGIASINSVWDISTSDQVSFRRRVFGNEYYLDFDRNIEAKLVPSFFTEYYSTHISLRRYIIDRIFVSAHLKYFPSTKLEIQAKEYFSVGQTFHREYDVEKTYNLYLFDFDVNIIPFWLLNAEWYISLGVYSSNKIVGDETFILDVVTPIVSEIKKDTTTITYSFESSGFRVGIGMEFPITKRVRFVSRFDYYPKQKMALNTREETNNLKSFSSSIVYRF